jgi:proteasome lid subunit RPN8/RPN11
MRIAPDVIADIEAHARDTTPEECCGLLLGTPERIDASVRARNIADDRRRRYCVDPQDHFSAIRRARTLGVEVVGAYHSHPVSSAVPSETDRAEAFESFVFLIVARSETRAWRLSSGNFAEVALVRLP